MLRAHHAAYGPTPDGRLFRGARGGPLSESVYGRAWQAARTLALSPELAASGLARRPYDLRHAALSLWLNSGGDPAQIAARAGHSVAVLLTVYSHCIHGRDDLLNQQIDHVLEPPQPLVRARPRESQRCAPTAQPCGKACGCTDRDGRDAVRHTSVTSPPGPPTARKPRRRQTSTTTPTAVIYPAQKQYQNKKRTADRRLIWPTAGPKASINGPRTARTGTQKPVPPSSDTGFDLRKQGGR
jgi:hypothetical protein